MILEAIEKRRSRRSLLNKEIPEDLVRDLITAIRFAPSCANKQEGKFLFARSSEARKKVIEALTPGNYWAHPAPLFVLAAVDEAEASNMSDNRGYGPFDLGLEVQNLLIQASSLGLVGHPMAGFDPEKLRAAFKIPANFRTYAVISFAYPNPDTSHLNANHLERETGERLLRPEEEQIAFDDWNF